MEGHLHKRFSDEELRKVFRRYENGLVDVSYMLSLLDIKRRRFSQLLKMFRGNPDGFTARRERKTINRKINLEVEEHLLHELHQEHMLIQDPQVPIQDFNDSYIRDELLLDTTRRSPCLQSSPGQKRKASKERNHMDAYPCPKRCCCCPRRRPCLLCRQPFHFSLCSGTGQPAIQA